jgi:hypothetical protein
MAPAVEELNKRSRGPKVPVGLVGIHSVFTMVAGASVVIPETSKARVLTMSNFPPSHTMKPSSSTLWNWESWIRRVPALSPVITAPVGTTAGDPAHPCTWRHELRSRLTVAASLAIAGVSQWRIGRIWVAVTSVSCRLAPAATLATASIWSRERSCTVTCALPVIFRKPGVELRMMFGACAGQVSMGLTSPPELIQLCRPCSRAPLPSKVTSSWMVPTKYLVDVVPGVEHPETSITRPLEKLMTSAPGLALASAIASCSDPCPLHAAVVTVNVVLLSAAVVGVAAIAVPVTRASVAVTPTIPAEVFMARSSSARRRAP